MLREKTNRQKSIINPSNIRIELWNDIFCNKP